ncbi:MAG TPA: ABC transporter substrate-binding protein [Xanthobacteraceae bacterium]|jgi:putative ABC transport system substrate-binding protein|nr:ABC transporter substrate-binding protein [Xanthobacteraceae bacterium]
MRRRDFVKVMSGAAAWPLAAHAQRAALPVIGFLNGGFAEGYTTERAAFLSGLNETGYVDGRNVTIEYRWAEGQTDRLPILANDLVRRQVAVIAATSTPAALAAKAATRTIPIVFEIGADPILLGLVASLNEPGSNITGITQTNLEVSPKRLELLHEIMPAAHVMVLLVDPRNPAVAEAITNQMQAAARTLGLDLQVINASNDDQVEAAFAKAVHMRANALVISAGDPFFTSQARPLAALSVRYAMPAVGPGRDFAAAGGLVAYGADINDAYRLAGGYTGRILKGEKPENLPVQQGTKAELVINLKAAKVLGLTIPLPILGRADEVIE